MLRTNPYKKKRRVAKRTLLMYGEGLGEEIFLKHLRGMYAYNSGTKVKIRNGKGGTPRDVIIGAANEIGGYNKRIVVIDNDKGKQEMENARKEAKTRNIELVEHSPCLEAMLLSILNDGKSFSDKTSSWCKKEFQCKYIEKKKRSELCEYKKTFPKKLLDKQRIKLVELNVLISSMEN